MKKSSFLSLILFGFLWVAACDQLEEDVTPEPVESLQLSSASKSVYISPGGQAIINLAGNLKLSSSAQLIIGKNPTRGGIEFLEGGLLRYAANQDFKSGSDSFILKVLKDTAVLDQDTIRIEIPADSANYPCWSGAQADNYFIPHDSIQGITREINILANDYRCDSSAFNLSVFTKPKYGTAELVNNYLHYTPGHSFTSYDELVYQLCEVKEGDRLHCTFASVSIGLLKGYNWECEERPVAENDFPIIWANDFSSDSAYLTQALEVFANDTICEALKHYYVSVPPKRGSAEFENHKLYYSFPKDFVGVDSLKYTICQTDSLCDEGTVFITIK